MDWIFCFLFNMDEGDKGDKKSLSFPSSNAVRKHLCVSF